MFGATEAGRVYDVHGFTLRVASDDYMRAATEAGQEGAQLILVLELGHMGACLTRAMWAEFVSYGNQVFGIHEETGPDASGAIPRAAVEQLLADVTASADATRPSAKTRAEDELCAQLRQMLEQTAPAT